MTDFNRLECRHNPPDHNGFPATRPDFWCAQHKARPAEPAPAPVEPLTTRPGPALTTRAAKNPKQRRK